MVRQLLLVVHLQLLPLQQQPAVEVLPTPWHREDMDHCCMLRVFYDSREGRNEPTAAAKAATITRGADEADRMQQRKRSSRTLISTVQAVKQIRRGSGFSWCKTV
jgi:hypothetical protein